MDTVADLPETGITPGGSPVRSVTCFPLTMPIEASRCCISPICPEDERSPCQGVICRGFGSSSFFANHYWRGQGCRVNSPIFREQACRSGRKHFPDAITEVTQQADEGTTIKDVLWRLFASLIRIRADALSDTHHALHFQPGGLRYGLSVLRHGKRNAHRNMSGDRRAGA